MSADNPLELLTTDEAAAVLRVGSPRTLERWRTEGTGPRFVRMGKRVAYSREALEAFVRARTVASTAEPDVKRPPSTTKRKRS